MLIKNTIKIGTKSWKAGAFNFLEWYLIDLVMRRPTVLDLIYESNSPAVRKILTQKEAYLADQKIGQAFELGSYRTKCNMATNQRFYKN